MKREAIRRKNVGLRKGMQRVMLLPKKKKNNNEEYEVKASVVIKEEELALTVVIPGRINYKNN